MNDVPDRAIENTVAYSFSLDEGMEVGCDLASPVTDDYPERNNAHRAIHWVRIDTARIAPIICQTRSGFDIAMVVIDGGQDKRRTVCPAP